MHTFKLKTGSGTDFIDITANVTEILQKTGQKDGICCVYVPHTTAAVTLNENADPSVCRDMIKGLSKLIPLQDAYEHFEGNSAAHIKCSLIGESVTIPIENNRLALGTWQSIYFCEFDGPRNRKVNVVCLAPPSAGDHLR